jgi:hypothetical protein
MATQAEPRMEDIARIAFVTQRFHELRGLAPAAFGAALIGASLIGHGMPAGYPGVLMSAWNFAAMFSGGAAVHLHRMYRHTFGEAVGPSRQQFIAGISVVIVMLGGMIDMFVPMGRPAPSVAAGALAACSIWVVVRDWRWRIHHLVPAAAGIIAATITATAPPLANYWAATDPARTETFLLAFTILGFGMVTAGLLDHSLLASSLGARSSAAFGVKQMLGRAASGGIRATIAGVVCVAAGGVLWSVSPKYTSPAVLIALILGFVVTQMLFAVIQISRAARTGVLAAAAPAVVRLHLGSDSLALMFVVALAAALESAIAPQGVTLLALAIGGASAWVAVRDWPYRGHYLVGALAAGAAVVVSSRANPARSLAILVFFNSGALMVEGLLDHFVARRHHRIEGLSDHGAVNVDTI